MLDIIGYVLLGIFLLIIPGFLFSLVLYPKLENLDFWSRAGVSLGLGAMLLIYVGFFIAKPELRMLQPAPFVGVTVGLCAALAILAYLRGGAEVVLAYTRAVVRFFKSKTSKPSRTPAPSQPKPEKQAQPHPEKKPLNNLPNRGAGSVDI
jgi:uncharacterized membrane protein